jgi:hypothetical protein
LPGNSKRGPRPDEADRSDRRSGIGNAQSQPVDSDIQGTREIDKRVVRAALAAETRVLDVHRIVADDDLVVTRGPVLGSAGPQAVAFDLWQHWDVMVPR